MIKEKRQHRILTLLRRLGQFELADVCQALPEVSRVTLRRDIAELAERGELVRTHGGARLPDVESGDSRPLQAVRQFTPRVVSALDGLDAIILPPISSPGGDVLRRQIGRSQIPFLAESAPQAGGVYLGPDNHRAAYELGQLAGKIHEASHQPVVPVTALMISQPELSNTQARSAGFEQGLREELNCPLSVIGIDGQGGYKAALAVASDVLHANDRINIIFGVNDHSALAGCDAAEMHERKVSVYATGGERADFVARVADNGPLKAVAAFFPSVVGATAIDALAGTLTGGTLPDTLSTSHAILTAENLQQFYSCDEDDHWSLNNAVFNRLVPESGATSVSNSKIYRIGFMPHYPAHDWYRSMIQSMQKRSALHGIELEITPPHQGINDEIGRLQQAIAVAAANRIQVNETVIIGEGAITLRLAHELRRLASENSDAVAGLNVITNSLDVLHQLHNVSQIKTVLTSGEFHAGERCLVGPSLAAIFERTRADKAFLNAAGVSCTFGASVSDERRALAATRFAQAARYTIVLADHTLIGADANYRTVTIDDIDEIITDDGVLPAERQALRTAGVDISVVNDSAAVKPSTKKTYAK